MDKRLKSDNGWGPGRKYTDAERKTRRKAASAKSNKKLKHEALMAYGGVFCINCGEARLDLLTLDHIDDDGAKHRRENNVKGGTPFYQAMKRQGWPPGLQVMCFNCNCSKGFSGRLPKPPRILHLTRGRLRKWGTL